MNFWTPTFDSWGKGLDAKDMPWFLLYDYVEVFTYDEDENEFNLLWRDDFDSFDEKRWHKASGGFDANSSVFHPDNVSVKAGHLVLKMEPLPETKSKPTKVAEPVIVHHDTPYIHQHVDRHFGDRIETPNRRHHREDLHAESFDRDMARAYRSPHHDSKFWMNKEDRREMSRNDEKEDYSEENDDATSSDSDQDWLEYQDYLHSHHEKGEHFVPHH